MESHVSSLDSQVPLSAAASHTTAPGRTKPRDTNRMGTHAESSKESQRYKENCVFMKADMLKEAIGRFHTFTNVII